MSLYQGHSAYSAHYEAVYRPARHAASAHVPSTKPSTPQQATPPPSTRPSLDVDNRNTIPSFGIRPFFTQEKVAIKSESKSVTPELATPPPTTPPSPHHHRVLPSFDNCPSLINNPHTHSAVDYLTHGIENFLKFDGPKDRLTISRVTLDLYEEIQPWLEKFEKGLRYEYDFLEEKMVVCQGPCRVHESTNYLINRVATTVNDDLSGLDGDTTFAEFGTTLARLHSEDGQNTRDKSADRSFLITSENFEDLLYLSFVVEIGYSESYAELKKDATHWLWESLGQVLSVLIVKFTKPRSEGEFGDIEKWNAYMELYVRKDESTTKEISLVGNRISFLPPRPDTAASLVLSIDHIMHNFQREALGSPDILAGLTWKFGIREVIRDARRAIAVMYSVKKPNYQIRNCTKRKLGTTDNHEEARSDGNNEKGKGSKRSKVSAPTSK